MPTIETAKAAKETYIIERLVAEFLLRMLLTMKSSTPNTAIYILVFPTGKKVKVKGKIYIEQSIPVNIIAKNLIICKVLRKQI